MKSIENIVLVEDLSKEFETPAGSFEALKNINLSIKKGELIILKGVSGSGKSTLLSILGGLDHPTSGKVIVAGESIAKLPDGHLSRFRATKVGIIFQHFNLIESLRVEDNVIAPLINQNLTLDKVL